MLRQARNFECVSDPEARAGVTPESEGSHLDLSSVKVAFAHDWLTGMRGGEKVLESLCSMFPQAPLWTLVHVPGSVSRSIEAREIHASFLQRMPLASKKYRHYLPLFPLAAELNKVRGDYDLVISTSHAVAKAMVKRDGSRRPLHVCYLHTPMRYIWDRFDDYFGPHKVGRAASHLFFRSIANLLRFYDRKTVDRVDVYCTNSHYVAAQVRRIYRREAVVIHPPCDLRRGLRPRAPEDWYLLVTALVPYKRVDHAIVACARLERRLVIAGKGPEESSLKRLARKLGAQVEFRGFISDNELLECYTRARGLLFPGIEDFGLVPVEAIAAGCPVIALAKGGVLDSMTDETAEFYTQESAQALQDAILRFETRQFSEARLRRHASQFAEEQFTRRFKLLLNRALVECDAAGAPISKRRAAESAAAAN